MAFWFIRSCTFSVLRDEEVSYKTLEWMGAKRNHLVKLDFQESRDFIDSSFLKKLSKEEILQILKEIDKELGVTLPRGVSIILEEESQNQNQGEKI